MEKARNRATTVHEYFVWTLLFALGTAHLVHPGDIAWGILLVSSAVGWLVQDLLKRSRTAFWVVNAALGAIMLGGAVAEIAGRHWVMVLVFLASGVILGWWWRTGDRRLRRAVS